jgi:cytochrome c553
MSPHTPKLIAFVIGLLVGRARAKRCRREAQQSLNRPGAAVPSPPVEMVTPSAPLQPQGWKRWLLQFGLFLLVLGMGGLLIAVSGIVPLRASSGHWAITRWFLQFSKERSMATYSLGTEVPALNKPWMVLKGAGHYETGCVSCHGGPARAPSAVANYMLPKPPPLTNVRLKWEPEELFQIVQHGIKFTGMPAWPGRHRQDEVWAMVAFLLALPELDGPEYHRLVTGEQPPAPPAQGSTAALAAERCARCHGFEGEGRGSGAFPKLAGQRTEYLLASLEAYAASQRPSGLMEPVAAALTPEARRGLAEYYSRLEPSFRHAPPSPSVAQGREIAQHGIPRQQVPACAACHLPNPEGRNPHYPNLAGQYGEYLELQLKLFKSKHRGGTAYAHIMEHVAARLTEAQMKEVAAYFESLGSGGP